MLGGTCDYKRFLDGHSIPELWNRVSFNTVSSIQYLMYILRIIQPCKIHLLQIVGAGAIKKRLRYVHVPHRLKRP